MEPILYPPSLFPLSFSFFFAIGSLFSLLVCVWTRLDWGWCQKCMRYALCMAWTTERLFFSLLPSSSLCASLFSFPRCHLAACLKMDDSIHSASLFVIEGEQHQFGIQRVVAQERVVTSATLAPHSGHLACCLAMPYSPMTNYSICVDKYCNVLLVNLPRKNKCHVLPGAQKEKSITFTFKQHYW